MPASSGQARAPLVLALGARGAVLLALGARGPASSRPVGSLDQDARTARLAGRGTLLFVVSKLARIT